MGIISSLGESLTRNVVQQNMTITCIIHQGGPINTKHAFNQCADLHNISPETEETSPAEGESLIYRTVTAHALAALQCHKNASNSTPSPHPLQ